MKWLVRLQKYDYTIVYREGKKHGNADGLSKLALAEGDNHIEDNMDFLVNQMYEISTTH